MKLGLSLNSLHSEVISYYEISAGLRGFQAPPCFSNWTKLRKKETRLRYGRKIEFNFEEKLRKLEMEVGGLDLLDFECKLSPNVE